MQPTAHISGPFFPSRNMGQFVRRHPPDGGWLARSARCWPGLPVPPRARRACCAALDQPPASAEDIHAAAALLRHLPAATGTRDQALAHLTRPSHTPAPQPIAATDSRRHAQGEAVDSRPQPSPGTHNRGSRARPPAQTADQPSAPSRRSVSWSGTFGMALCNRLSSGKARTLPLCAAAGSMPIMVQAAHGRVFSASAISFGAQIAGSAGSLVVRGSPVRMRRIDRPAAP
jgi:hypothetical protein